MTNDTVLALNPGEHLGSTSTDAGGRILCVDLDGTLVRSDLLLESMVLLLRLRPWLLLLLPLWMLSGKAAFKAKVAARVHLNLELLPYNRPLIHWLEIERRSGRSIWLCTSANESIARSIAAHLNIFDGTLASDGTINLTGENKAACLEQRFGYRKFDYCGNERRDIHIWKRAHGAIVVGRGHKLAAEAAKHAVVLQSFCDPESSLRFLIRVLRPHQWAKNLLVLVPLFTAHLLRDVATVALALIAAITFCLCASSVYVFNDLLDLEADRAHASKSSRPFAAGDLSVTAGLWLAPLLLATAFLVASFLPPRFLAVLATYYGLTVLYSFVLKAQAVIDTMTLSVLYTLRIIAGAAAIRVELSNWLLCFSMFLFTSLAYLKRFAELHELQRQNLTRAAGRGYVLADLSIVQSLGTAAGYLSVVVLALYIDSREIHALYRRPELMWPLCFLMLYWVSRVWMKAQRGEMHEDPVIFALKDSVSLVVGVLVASIVGLAL